jgi:hypothetical protein
MVGVPYGTADFHKFCHVRISGRMNSFAQLNVEIVSSFGRSVPGFKDIVGYVSLESFIGHEGAVDLSSNCD